MALAVAFEAVVGALVKGEEFFAVFAFEKDDATADLSLDGFEFYEGCLHELGTADLVGGWQGKIFAKLGDEKGGQGVALRGFIEFAVAADGFFIGFGKGESIFACDDEGLVGDGEVAGDATCLIKNEVGHGDFAAGEGDGILLQEALDVRIFRA